MKKCLITGINGFVGSYLASELLLRGFSVYGTYMDISFGNIKSIQDKLRLYPADILDKEKISGVIKNISPDYIFHLAAVTSVAASFKNPDLTMRVNVEGTRNVLESAGKAMVLLTCSADEYGKVKEEDLPLKETHPLAPMNPYAESKKKSEELALQLFRENGVQVIISRSFNHTGPRQAPDFVSSDWAKQIAEIETGKREPVIMVGNLEVKRDFLDVRDVVKAYVLLVEKGIAGEVYNVASGNCYGLKEILNILLGFSAAKIEVRQDPARMRPSDNPVYCGDNTRIRKLGWKAEYPIKNTLHDLLKYWRESI